MNSSIQYKMDSIWFSSQLSDEIIKDHGISNETKSVVSDIITNRIDVVKIVENMAGVLTNKEPENREKGMRFFTKLLQELPYNFLNETQVKFISNFYIDRLKDNHRVLPPVLEGYLYLIDMKNYEISCCCEFFTILFREVACQSQVRQDRYHIYLILHKLLEKDIEYMKTLGPDFVYGVISAMDGERDPRNLLFLFSFLPKFISQIPLGHLVDEMFEVISCYYPIDFHPSPDDPAKVTRQDLATALAPCLYATPEFADQTIVLLIEKLDSNLRTAKLDSLKLLTSSCEVFKPQSFFPFLKTLWSSIHRDITNKSDEEIKMAAHESLSTLVSTLATTANTDHSFETFLKSILISMQTAIAETATVVQFIQATRVLLTTANASKESCIFITKAMIPAALAFYGFKTSSKLQIASIEFLGELYDLAKHWDVLDSVDKEVKEIPQQCLVAVSQPAKEYQLAGFKTLIKAQNVLESDLVVPFVEILIHTVQNCQDNDLLRISIEAVHSIARKYPELIMSLVIKGKCNLECIVQDKSAIKKRLNLLSSLASIDAFTKVIVEEMLSFVAANDNESPKIVEALSESLSNSSLYTVDKIQQIESDHGLIDSILTWLLKEIQSSPYEALAHGYTLVTNTIGSLPHEKQVKILSKHTQNAIDQCRDSEIYFLIIESLYNSIHQSVYDDKFKEIMSLSLDMAINCVHDTVRNKACVVIAHFLNKAEHGSKFTLLYEYLKDYLSSCKRDDEQICPRLVILYGWITKALIMRGSDLYLFWLQKITSAISTPEYSQYGAEAIRIIMADFTESLSTKQHCRVSLLYKQRMFQSLSKLTDKMSPEDKATKENYLLSWGYVLEKTPKSVLNGEVDKITPLIVDSLEFDNKELLYVMLEVLLYFIQLASPTVADSFQTILPRIVKLTKYGKSMDVRIKSLQCLFDTANLYRTILLLPYKQDVLLDLAPALDDNKRLVRNVAVKARTRWFLVGAPGEAKEN